MEEKESLWWEGLVIEVQFEFESRVKCESAMIIQSKDYAASFNDSRVKELSAAGITRQTGP